MDELVHLEVAGGVATVTLDSPANRNALSRRLTTDLARQLTAALADERARVIVLTGTGSVFCAGADLKEQRQANESGSQAPAPPSLASMLSMMWHSPKPVVGRINGAARAGGLGLVAACDIAVAEATTTFAVNEVRIGVIPALISVVVVPKLGEARALELFLTGEVFDGTAAARYGLLNAAAPPGELDTTVKRYVEALLKGAPNALAGCKQLVRDVPTMPMDEAFAEMAQRSAAYFASVEALEGMTAFAEKRPPRWTAGV